MFTKIRQKDLKKVLWFLAVIIIISFVFWGSSRYTNQKEDFFIKIYNKTVSPEIFSALVKNIQVFLIAQYGREYINNIDYELLKKIAIEHLVLNHKANKEKIQVTDQDLFNTLTSLNQFRLSGRFNKEQYLRFLGQIGITPGNFESFLKQRIAIDKLLTKSTENIQVTDQELLDTYKQENEKAKIDYVYIKYENIAKNISIDNSEIENFYKENKSSFLVPNKIKIEYIKLPKDTSAETIDRVKKEIAKKTLLSTIANDLKLSIQTSDFFAANEAIKDIGWNDTINSLAFNSPKGQTEGPLQIEDGLIVFSKSDEKSSYIPDLPEIIDLVKEKAKMNKAKIQAKTLTQEILNKISEAQITQLKEINKYFPDTPVISTDFFKRGDFIENIGINQLFFDQVFKLKKDEIAKEFIEIDSGLCLIQMVDFLSIDEKKFEEEKDTFKAKVLFYKQLSAQQQFILNTIKESNLQIKSIKK